MINFACQIQTGTTEMLFRFGVGWGVSLVILVSAEVYKELVLQTWSGRGIGTWA